jgi:predicted dienelactone hydrolase
MYQVIDLPDVRLTTDNGREFSVRVRGPRLPADNNLQLPLIIFSHGAGGSSDAFSELCSHWASHGYVVVNPTHSDSIKQRRQQGERLDFSDPQTAWKQVIGGVNIIERRRDVVTILDNTDILQDVLSAAENSTGRVRIDPEKIGMAGHSAGAMTTVTMAGVRFYPPRRENARPISWPDERIKSFILISGQGVSGKALKEDSWKDISQPMLVLAGSKDVVAVTTDTPETRRHPYEYAPEGDKYLLFIDGATHSSYAGAKTSRITGETPPENIDYITSVTSFSTTAFFDHYLKQDPAAKAYLTEDAITQYPGGKSQWLKK